MNRPALVVGAGSLVSNILEKLMTMQKMVTPQQAQQGAEEDASLVQYRRPHDQGESWTLDRAPLRRSASRSVIVNLGCSSCTCVMAGSQILLADGTTKAVESFTGGEKVRTLSGVATSVGLEVTQLGATRRIIELDAGDGDPLYVSDEHLMWTRHSDGQQWWGTYNFHQYWFETQLGTGTPLEQAPKMLRWDLKNEHAHIDGWKRVRPTFCYLVPETPLYHVLVDNGGSYIANGFVITSHCTDDMVEGVNWQGIDVPQRALPEFKLPASV